ncbi:MAG: flagellar motor stator protein MotA [Myxococcota bacterium]|jgi:chemotaxis protein MotA|nr:flagellar motor stator protein MotA [Myxococcota bacterium]
MIGFVVVLVAVLGGYALSGGPFAVLFQPYELLVIGGAALGALIVSAPGAVLKRVTSALKHGLKAKPPTKQDYLDLLGLLYQLFQKMRRDGVLTMEEHVADPSKSPIFTKFPSVLARHHAVHFLADGLKQLVDGCSPEDLLQLCDADVDTHEAAEHEPVGLIQSTGDALPGLGIVAAVLGIVITMGHLDAGPEEIGHHVAAALVGTFLGILMCYGFVGPLATRIANQGAADMRYMNVIKSGLLAASRGTSPQLSIEFARRAIFPDERPSGAELEAAFQAAKG